MIFCERERIDNDAVFGALYLVHLVCLLLDGHVLVNDTDTALPCNGDRHLCFCDGVHRRCHHRCFQLDGTCQRCAQINHIRCYVRFCRNQQNVIKRQPLFSEFFTKFCCHNDPPFNHICLNLCPAFVRMRGQALKKSMHRKCFGKAPGTTGYYTYHTLFSLHCQAFRRQQTQIYTGFTISAMFCYTSKE